MQASGSSADSLFPVITRLYRNSVSFLCPLHEAKMSSGDNLRPAYRSTCLHACMAQVGAREAHSANSDSLPRMCRMCAAGRAMRAAEGTYPRACVHASWREGWSS